MLIVTLVALAVGGATLLGGALGFVFSGASERTDTDTSNGSRSEKAILYFASGLMLAAAVIGLIIPSLDSGGPLAFPTTILGVFGGAFAVNFLDKFIPDPDRLIKSTSRLTDDKRREAERVLLFAGAIAVHNFPEGLAAGVGFGGDFFDAIKIAGSIALQNIPEGAVIITPLLSIGMSRTRAFLISAASGLVEIVGTFIGYCAVSFSTSLLPFALAFAGGTMLYVVSCEMPTDPDRTHAQTSAYAFLVGFSVMLAIDHFI